MKFFSRLSWIALVAGIMFCISACGQKGRLVVPVKPPAVSTPYPVATPKENTENGADSEIKPEAAASTPEVSTPPNKD
ncbi:hypothetical protein [Solimicrobium silvestre]|uniref:Prokaryotic lipoprotein-attachment site n=1 Tax=Solimicrobium silvestre TaxID=2099400 RepID=A0A2S9H467_9BURK|nr:hypothetical protein [Solimicrobium silvestre]PRC94774.1 hypothetical protein S2091_0777 [Solimicrobium silvestre]